MHNEPIDRDVAPDRRVVHKQYTTKQDSSVARSAHSGLGVGRGLVTPKWWMNHGSRTKWWRPDAVDREDLAQVLAPAKGTVNDSAVPFWALMAFTLILLTAPQTFVPALASLRVALLAAVVAITAYLADRFIHRRPILIFTAEIRTTACLVGWAILTVPFSIWPGGTISFLTGFYFKTVTVFLLLSQTVSSLTRLRQVAWGLSLMGVVLAGSAVRSFLTGSFMPASHEGIGRITGYNAPLADNPNDLALVLNLILPLTVALVLTTRNRMARAVSIVVLLLDVIAVILTFSRAGFLTLAATAVSYLWKLRRRPERRWVLTAGVIALVAAPLLPSGYSGRLATIVNIQSDPTGSAQARWNDTISAARFMLRNPIIGAGAGENTLALNEERGPSWVGIHNVYLEYAVELGIPGLVLFLLLAITSIKSAKFVQSQAARMVAFRELGYFGEAIQISLIAFMVAALFHPVGYHFYFYYVAGLAAAVRIICQPEISRS